MSSKLSNEARKSLAFLAKRYHLTKRATLEVIIRQTKDRIEREDEEYKTHIWIQPKGLGGKIYPLVECTKLDKSK